MPAPRQGHRRAVIGDVASAVRLAVEGDGPRTLVLTAGPGTGKTHTLGGLVESLGVDMALHRTGADDLSWRRPLHRSGVAARSAAARHRPRGFSDTLHAAVASLTDHGPCLMAVDDVHNADSDSLQFLDELTAEAGDLPLVVLLARRHLPVRGLLTRLLAHPRVREWHLPLMDAADLSALTHDLLGGRPNAPLADALSRSGCNPLHARAILDELHGVGAVEDGWAKLLDTVDGEPPTTLHTAVLHTAVGRQLALLDGNSRVLVQKLAVWGGPAGLEDLVALDGVPLASLVGTAQTAIDAGIVVATGNGAMAFAHDLYAGVAY